MLHVTPSCWAAKTDIIQLWGLDSYIPMDIMRDEEVIALLNYFEEEEDSKAD